MIVTTYEDYEDYHWGLTNTLEVFENHPSKSRLLGPNGEELIKEGRKVGFNLERQNSISNRR